MSFFISVEWGSGGSLDRVGKRVTKVRVDPSSYNTSLGDEGDGQGTPPVSTRSYRTRYSAVSVDRGTTDTSLPCLRSEVNRSSGEERTEVRRSREDDKTSLGARPRYNRYYFKIIQGSAAAAAFCDFSRHIDLKFLFLTKNIKIFSVSKLIYNINR